MRRTTMACAGLIALALAASAKAGGPALPNDVTQALAAPDCAELIELNRHYWSLPADPLREAATARLEEAILGLPGCGVLKAELVRVEPVSGDNFFDFRSPLGSAARGR